jgi:hypothetical protein
MKRSSTPPAAKTSASPRVATVSPSAPAASCREAISSTLWVFAWGTQRDPAGGGRRGHGGDVRVETALSTRTAGVVIPFGIEMSMPELDHA